LHFVYFDLPRWFRWWKREQRGVQLYYYLWQVGAFYAARRTHRKVRVDLVHHVTFVSYWKPSLLAMLPVPFLWGPVGGGDSAPKAFWADSGLRGSFYEAIREGARWLGEQDPFVRVAARRSVLALATTEETAGRMRKLGARDVRVFSQVGLNEAEIERSGTYEGGKEGIATFVSIGRLLHWKGFHLGLRAFARADLPDSEYWVVGDGPERKRLQALSEQLGVAGRVTFCGQLSREETLSRLDRCDVLIHPSLHDSGGWVCLEAMAAGHPVVCLDLGGPATQVTQETGIKVAAHNPRQAVVDLAKAMKALAASQDLMKRMGEAGRERVAREFSWSRKAENMSVLYDSVLGEKTTSHSRLH
jgi:glycosyltransferase involved in cell wall biosynthesis